MADVVAFSKDGDRRINMFEADLIFRPKENSFHRSTADQWNAKGVVCKAVYCVTAG